MNFILTIPNQQFVLFRDSISITEEDVVFHRADPITGTIVLATEVYEGLPDSLACFGLKEGEKEGGFALWKPFTEIEVAWEQFIEAKNNIIKKFETGEKK